MPILFLFLALWAIAFPAQAALRDLSGHPVTEGTYRRIVSLAPSNTELLYALGAGERVVGVSDRCDYPPEVTHKPRVGGADNLSVERVLALRPDLVLGIASKSPALIQLAHLLKAPVVLLPSGTLDSVAQNALELERLLKPARPGFSARFRRELSAIKPSRRHPRVFYLVWDRPLMTAGSGTFLDDVIRRAGGINVAQAKGYPMYSEERLMAEAPEVVLYPDNLRPGAQRLQSRLGRTTFVALPADAVSRPGPRILPLIRQLAGTLSRLR